MPKNCNECKYHDSCNSYYGGLGCKYKIRPSVIAMILVMILSIGSVASAMTKDEEPEVNEVIEVIEIDAEDIGIETIETEVEEDEDVITEDEDLAMDEDYIQEEEPEVTEPVEEEDTSEPPEGMAEGYVAGEYFPVNCYDCELHTECFKCEECTFEEEESYDEDRDIYMLDKWCIVCGHGTSEPLEE